MVREITLMEYFENHLDIKFEKVDIFKKPFNKSATENLSRGNSLEEFIFLTNLHPAQIEEEIIEFYEQQGYEPLERSIRELTNLHIDYKFQRGDEIKKVSFTLSSESGLAIVSRYDANIFKQTISLFKNEN